MIAQENIQLKSIPLKTIKNQKFVNNQLVIRFHIGKNPEELVSKIESRKNKSESFLGKISVLTENLFLRLEGNPMPEDELRLLSEAEVKVGVKDKKRAFKPNTSILNSYYIYEFEGEPILEDIEKIFKELNTVLSVEKNLIAYVALIPNDPYYQDQWHLHKIEAPKAWDITTGSSAVRIAVIDTGYDYTRIDKPLNIVLGTDYYYGDNDPFDDNGHGTAVAGLIAAETNNLTQLSGLNWRPEIYVIKVLGGSDGAGSMLDISQGIIEAADSGSKVLNLSLGGSGSCPSYMQDAIAFARSKGAMVIVAAGNQNMDAIYSSPANCFGTVVVAATGPNDERASYSNFGTSIDIAAPGGNENPDCTVTRPFKCILVPELNNDIFLSVGTSIAAPLVSGAAGLLLSVKPTLTNDQVETILKSTADTINTDEPIGKRLNVFKAVSSLVTPTVILSPTATSTPSPTQTLTNTLTPTSKPGDANSDGRVDGLDYVVWLNNYGRTATGGPDIGDFNTDGRVDGLDYIVWLTNYGS